MSRNEKPKEKLKRNLLLWGEIRPNFRRKLEQLDLVRATADRSDICVLGFSHVYTDTRRNTYRNMPAMCIQCAYCEQQKEATGEVHNLDN